MTAERFQRLVSVGAVVLGCAMLVALFLSPLDAIWTAAVTFAFAAVIWGLVTMSLRGRWRRGGGHNVRA